MHLLWLLHCIVHFAQYVVYSSPSKRAKQYNRRRYFHSLLTLWGDLSDPTLYTLDRQGLFSGGIRLCLYTSSLITSTPGFFNRNCRSLPPGRHTVPLLHPRVPRWLASHFALSLPRADWRICASKPDFSNNLSLSSLTSLTAFLICSLYL